MRFCGATMCKKGDRGDKKLIWGSSVFEYARVCAREHLVFIPRSPFLHMLYNPYVNFMRTFLLTFLLSSTAVAQRPNLVFLYSDDHAAHAVSAYQKHLKYATKLPATPNIDRI